MENLRDTLQQSLLYEQDEQEYKPNFEVSEDNV